jgi:hypothetical protein
MARDFNEACWQKEHFSASERNERQMAAFRDTLFQCDLHDLGYKGLPWTFDNKKVGIRNVKVRLDRAVASPSWMANFPNATVSHLVSSRSDHYPLLIDLEKSETLSASRKPWRYEMMWEREQSLDVEIERSWMKGKEASNIQDIKKSFLF